MAKRRVVASRRVRPNGIPGGASWIESEPAAGDIDIDNDGVFNPTLQFVVDISEIASSILGRQVSMTRSVTLNAIGIGVRPVDDVTDNDESAFFAGRFQFYPATDHGKKALGLAARMEREIESHEVDGDSYLLSDDQDYSGLRLGWTDTPSNQVLYQTNGWPNGGEYTYSKVFSAYNAMTVPPQSNALFSGRAPEPMSVQWVCALASGIGAGDSPPPGGQSADWNLQTRVEIFPLLRGLVEYSSGDEDGLVDDDYYVHVYVDFTVEE